MSHSISSYFDSYFPKLFIFPCPGSPKGHALKALQFDHVAALATSLPHLPQAFENAAGVTNSAGRKDLDNKKIQKEHKSAFK